MSPKIFARLIIITVFALTFGFLATIVSAESAATFAQPAVGDCQACHWVVRDAWEAGDHGQEGVACETCHSPVNQNHPKEAMPTDISSRLCATCHESTDLEFEASVHGQEDLTCIRCHNSHTASIKTESVQTLCENCHQDLTHFFSFSVHADNGIQCIDCHLPIAAEMERVGPGHRVHTFEANMDTCKECHSQEMHESPVEPCTEEEAAAAEQQGLESICPPEEEVVAAGFMLPEDEVLSIEPGKTSPVGFAIIGTLVGVAAGMLLSPWLEKWFARFQR